MILLLGMLVGVAVAWALGGNLALLADVRLRSTSLVFAALALQILLFTPLSHDVPASMIGVLDTASYALLVLFTARNLRRPGVWLLTAGLAANTVVIAANSGRMPVSFTAWRASGLPVHVIRRAGYDHNNVLIGPHTHLAWLADRFALPPTLPWATAISIGDVLIAVGMTAFIYCCCAPASPPREASVLAPLRISAFRHILAGRLASTFGDWLAMVAVVTWVFARTHSTLAVSAFLVARITATILGSALSAPLLDRMRGFRVLALVETSRGALTATMIPAAATGHLLTVAGLVCASSFLGAATSPSARGLIPDLVPDADLHQANSLHGVARNTTMVAGSLIAAVSVVHYGITSALLVDLATFLIAALLYARFRSFRPPAAHHQRLAYTTIARPILRHRTVFGLVSSFTFATIGIGLLNATLPSLLQYRLGEPGGYGYALAAIGAGLMLGELLTAFIRHDRLVRRSIPIAFAATGLLLYLVSSTPLAATGMLFLFLLGAADGITEITYDTLLQREVPEGLRAGVFALGSAVQNGGMIVGLAAAALFAATQSQTAIRTSALLCIAAATLAAATLARRPRHANDPSTPPHRPPNARAASEPT